MKDVLVVRDCKYAQSKPHLPAMDFKELENYSVPDYMADSMIKNGDAVDDSPEPEYVPMVEPEIKETAAVEPEIKEKPIKKGKRNKS